MPDDRIQEEHQRQPKPQPFPPLNASLNPCQNRGDNRDASQDREMNWAEYFEVRLHDRPERWCNFTTHLNACRLGRQQAHTSAVGALTHSAGICPCVWNVSHAPGTPSFMPFENQYTRWADVP